MTGTVALALALMPGSTPIANIVCAAWCDVRSGVNSASVVCHREPAQGPFGAFASPDACEVFASTPFIREDTRRVAPAAISVDVALPVVLPAPGYGSKGDVLVETPRLAINRAQILVLRI
jgi:hypothetical protein